MRCFQCGTELTTSTCKACGFCLKSSTILLLNKIDTDAIVFPMESHPAAPEESTSGPRNVPQSSQLKKPARKLALPYIAASVAVIVLLLVWLRPGSTANNGPVLPSHSVSSGQNPGHSQDTDSDDQAYQDTVDYCQTIDTLSAVEYLSNLADSSGDARYRDLLASYIAQLESETLSTAKSYMRSGDHLQAITTIWNIQKRYNCPAFSDMLFDIHIDYSTHRIAAGRRYVAKLASGGKVTLSGKSEKTPCDTSGWSNIKSIAVGDFHVVGLNSSGKVVATGPSEYYNGVANWASIVVLAAGDGHTVGLTADGKVMAAGMNQAGQCNVGSLQTSSPIVSVAAGYEFTIALHADGTVSSVGNINVSGWRNIVSISAGSEHAIGLRSDGTVVSVGSNKNGQINTGGWFDIIAVAAGDYFSMGLCRDGSVVAVGQNSSGQCNVGSWYNVAEIAAGNHTAVGLTRDGQLLRAGD